MTSQQAAPKLLEPSISVVRHAEIRTRKHGWSLRGLVKPLSVALILGALTGLAGSFLLVPRPYSKQHWVQAEARPMLTQTVITVAYAAEPASAKAVKAPRSVSSEVEAVRIRNRRLEALVKVLRKRNADERRGFISRHAN